MRLIAISPNILANPESIDCIEQVKINGVDITYIWIGERSYVLGFPLNDFYRDLDSLEQDSPKQFFAG